ncbi:hypothetical protein ACS0TY_004102 [Phlomoides rotata]
MDAPIVIFGRLLVLCARYSDEEYFLNRCKVSVSKRFFCKGWKTSPNRAHICKDKGTKGYRGVSVSKRFFCKGWKTSLNRAHRCKDKRSKGYRGGRCSSYFNWKGSIHSLI